MRQHAHHFHPSRPVGSRMAPALILTLALGSLLAANPVVAAPDLQITALTVQGTAQVGTCNKVNITVRNNGDEFTNTASIALRLITFPSATPTQNRVEKDLMIGPIQPGNFTSFTITDVEFKVSGSATMQGVVDVANAVAESNENNNFTTTQTSVSGQCYAVPPPPPPPPPSTCDLSAVFTAPSGSSVSAGPVNLVVRFKSEAKGDCKGNKVKLMRYTGRSCSGYGSQVGGSGNFQTLNPLSSGQTQDVSFSEKATKGGYCYKIVYSSPHNDTNNYNHHPTKTLAVN